MSYYAHNKPLQLSNGTYTSTFEYGPNGNYWKQVATYSNGTETTRYIGGLLEIVQGPSVTSYRHHIKANGRTVAIYSRGSNGANNTIYPLSDHLGSTDAVTNSSGGIVVRQSFAAFGGRRSGATWSGAPSGADMTAIGDATRRGYTEHSMLDNIGLIHMNGRVQDPLLGRFVSPDPNIDGELTTQGWNRYSYVKNRSLVSIDPNGYNDCLLAFGVEMDDDACFWAISLENQIREEEARGAAVRMDCSNSFLNPTSACPRSLAWALQPPRDSTIVIPRGAVLVATTQQTTVLENGVASTSSIVLYNLYANGRAQWDDLLGVYNPATGGFSVSGHPGYVVDEQYFGQRLTEELGSFGARVALGARNTAEQAQEEVVYQAIGIGAGAAVGWSIGWGISAARAIPSLSDDIARTFAGGRYHSRVLQQDVVAYRYSGGTSPAPGRFLTTSQTVEQIGSSAAAQRALSLPAGATAEQLNAFVIPRGTTIYYGRVAGGGERATQIFIQDASVLRPLP